jgi:hypothetical protein
MIARMYAKGDRTGTVQYARHLGCSAARADAWIVEIDDHDFLRPGALEHVRKAIALGAVFVYGDCQWVSEDGRSGEVFEKANYERFMLRDSHCPAEGLRAFPARLYRDVGGYRWEGRVGFVNECEFPAGDFGLFLRMEAALDGFGFVRVPHVLCESRKVVGGISTKFQVAQSKMARALKRAALDGTLRIPPLSDPVSVALAAVALKQAESIDKGDAGDEVSTD